jgi:regulation of enolase protein 1 (concanavalin A-like superfamily)
MRLEKMGASQVLMYGVLGGTVTSNTVSLPSSYNPLYLKLEKCGTALTGSWSSDGIAWNAIPQFTFNVVDPVQVGLVVINAGSVAFSADFDYFSICPQLFVVPEYPLGTLAIPIAMAAAFLTYRHKPWAKKTKPA